MVITVRPAKALEIMFLSNYLLIALFVGIIIFSLVSFAIPNSNILYIIMISMLGFFLFLCMLKLIFGTVIYVEKNDRVVYWKDYGFVPKSSKIVSSGQYFLVRPIGIKIEIESDN